MSWLAHGQQDTVEWLAAHAAGEDRTTELAQRCRYTREQVEEALAAMLSAVTGGPRERLSRLALSLGIYAHWQEQARSGNEEEREAAVARLAMLSWGLENSTLMAAALDQDGAVRIEGSRALLRGGVRATVEQVFREALGQPPEVRAALSADLQNHALLLAEQALPQALNDEDPERLVAALEFVASWGRALPLPMLAPLLRHHEARVRARALRAVLYDSSMRLMESEVVKALWDDSAEVRAAACAGVARLRLESAIPSLLECLRHPDPMLAEAAAAALAEMGPGGLAALENEIRLAWDPSTAAAALAAVEQVRGERYGYTKF